MAAKNAKIKVIKRNQAAQVAAPKTQAAEKKNAAREMVSTVTNWVSDFQARKREETRVAIETFLVTKPRPSEL